MAGFRPRNIHELYADCKSDTILGSCEAPGIETDDLWKVQQIGPVGAQRHFTGLFELATIPWFVAEGSCTPGFVSDIDHA